MASVKIRSQGGAVGGQTMALGLGNIFQEALPHHNQLGVLSLEALVLTSRDRRPKMLNLTREVHDVAVDGRVDDSSAGGRSSAFCQFLDEILPPRGILMNAQYFLQ